MKNSSNCTVAFLCFLVQSVWFWTIPIYIINLLQLNLISYLAARCVYTSFGPAA